MSLIRIKIDEVRILNTQLRENTSDLISVKMKVSSLRYSVDSRVMARRNIGSRVNSSINSMNSIEAKLEELHSFINKSMDRYSEAELQVHEMADRISGLNAIQSSIFGMGDFKATERMSNMEIWMTGNISGIRGEVNGDVNLISGVKVLEDLHKNLAMSTDKTEETDKTLLGLNKLNVDFYGSSTTQVYGPPSPANGSYNPKTDTSSKGGINSDNNNEGGESIWDTFVGSRFTSGAVAAADRNIGIGVEGIVGKGAKVSVNQIASNMKDLGYNHDYGRSLLREIPKEARNIEVDIPKGLKLAKGLGFVTVGLTILSVVDDFKNNKTVEQKVEASAVDIGMTGVAYAAGTFAVGAVTAVCTILAAPEIVVAVATVIIVVGVAYEANKVTGIIKSALHLW